MNDEILQDKTNDTDVVSKLFYSFSALTGALFSFVTFNTNTAIKPHGVFGIPWIVGWLIYLEVKFQILIALALIFVLFSASRKRKLQRPEAMTLCAALGWTCIYLILAAHAYLSK